MKRDKSTKVIVIIALVIAVVGVSLGFATYSEYLKISSEASVTPDISTFNVKFSTTADTITLGTVTPTGNGDEATISGTTISGIKANFTNPGDEVVYNFYVRNSGEYDAYLTAVTFEKLNKEEIVDGETITTEVDKICSAVAGISDGDLVQSACNDIKVYVTVGNDENTKNLISGLGNITGHLLQKSSYEPITVKIAYVDNDNRADRDFTVEFGRIVLSYSSVDNTEN